MIKLPKHLNGYYNLKNEEDIRNSRLLVIYSEALKQYTHEDVMSHTKNTFFLSSHGAMLAVLTGISSVVIKIGTICLQSFLNSIRNYIIGFYSGTYRLAGIKN